MGEGEGEGKGGGGSAVLISSEGCISSVVYLNNLSVTVPWIGDSCWYCLGGSNLLLIAVRPDDRWIYRETNEKFWQ